VVLGSLVDLAPAERMDVLIADAVAKGAKVVAGGKRNGTVVEATLLDHVKAEMKIYNEESFGPVKSIIRVKGVDEAVRVANDTEYGLSAAVFGRDVIRAMAVAKRIESGICHINGPTVADEAQMPFGGMKASGYGRFGGKAVIDEFTDLRWITIEGPQHYPFWVNLAVESEQTGRVPRAGDGSFVYPAGAERLARQGSVAFPQSGQLASRINTCGSGVSGSNIARRSSFR
jgi:vanillin dehydrogenase